MHVTTFWSQGKIVMKWAFRKRVGCGVDSFGSRQGQVEGCCEEGNEPSGSIK